MGAVGMDGGRRARRRRDDRCHVARTLDGRKIAFPLRFLGAFALFYGFGWMWADLIGHLEPRQLAGFLADLVPVRLALAGLWFGTVFLVVGLGATALIVAAYFWSGAWFALWLALVYGGGFVLCGLWMRRA